MTTIAWDGKHLVADRRCTSQSGVLRGTRKIYEAAGFVLGAAGRITEILPLVRWLTITYLAIKVTKPSGLADARDVLKSLELDTASRPTFKEDEAPSCIAVDIKTGEPWVITGERPEFSRIEEQFFAVGSGREFALGAMGMGADARLAVTIAHRFDVWTSKEMDVVEVPSWSH